METNELDCNLLNLFSRTILVKKIKNNCLTILEAEEDGKLEVSFTNGRFTRFSENKLGKMNISDFFNPEGKEIIGKICDGIFLVYLEDRIILCLVELKKNINNKFKRAVQQIEGSYIKIAMLLSLMCNIKDIELAVFIGGQLDEIVDDPDIDYLKKDADFTEGENPESKLKDFSLHGKVFMNFPFFLEQTIHENYRKKNIPVIHLEAGAAFNMQTL